LQAHQFAEYEKRESEVKFQLNELTKGVSFYRRLGLEFEKIDADKLKLVFTLIDPAAPSKTYSFNVRITAADNYEVDEVNPPIAGVDVLLTELNTNNDFSRFVQLMRKKFVDTTGAGLHV
jgi:hypothetical protein